MFFCSLGATNTANGDYYAAAAYHGYYATSNYGAAAAAAAAASVSTPYSQIGAGGGGGGGNGVGGISSPNGGSVGVGVGGGTPTTNQTIISKLMIINFVRWISDLNSVCLIFFLYTDIRINKHDDSLRERNGWKFTVFVCVLKRERERKKKMNEQMRIWLDLYL